MRTTSSLLLLGATLAAQAPPPPTFAEPVRLKAGDKFLGENRLFPSPVFHDINADGRADIVVGDLIGKLTVALRTGDKAPAYAAETKQQALDGKELNFANW